MNAPDTSADYLLRRREIAHYFDRTAVDAWRQLTSDVPLGRIRSSVREGRQRMRDTLLSWLPPRLDGQRVLDAGCGTGAVSVELARRGAQVVAADLSPTLIELARERLPADVDPARIEFVSGDMLAVELGEFDHLIAMDSLIHYCHDDVVAALTGAACRVRGSILFTCVPLSPLLAAKRSVGRLFPRADRAPDVQPCRLAALSRDIERRLGAGWQVRERQRVSSGFYTSEALRLVPS